MNHEEQLVKRLTRFYEGAKREVSATPPVWVAPGRQRGRWIQPVLASAALAAVALSVGVGIRMARENRNPPTVATSPTVSASASPTPSATPTPAPSPGPNWVTQRFAVGSVKAMTLDSSAAFALGPSKLSRIDRSSRAVTTVAAQANASGIAETSAGVWVAGGPGTAPAPANSTSLTLFDAATLQVKRQAPLPGQPGSDVNAGPQLDGNASLLWLGYGNHVYRLDPDTGSTRLMQALPGTAVSISLDPSGQRLYVGIEVPSNASGQDRVLELDASTGATLASSESQGRGLGGPHVTGASDGVWVSYATGTMGAVEHRSAVSLAPTGNSIRTSNTIHAVVGAGALWLIDGMAQQLTCADPGTGATRASSPESEPQALVVDSNAAYLGDATGVAAMQPPAACRG